jgi:hypothetical protein
MRNHFSILTILFLSLGITSVGQQDKSQPDTLPKDSNKTVIYVTKDNLTAKLDSIRAVRKDSLSKLKLQGKSIDNKIDKKFEELESPQKKNIPITKKKVLKEKKTVYKTPVKVESETLTADTSGIKQETPKVKQGLFKRVINKIFKNKKQKENG